MDGVGKPIGILDQAVDAGGEAADQGLHRGAGFGGVARDVGVEETLRDDLERDAHHVVLHVAGLAVAPALEHPLGGRHHGRGIGGDPVAVERRLRELALLPPEVALARQQAVAQAGARLAERAVLDEVARLRDQHLLDEVGMIQHPNPHRAEPKIDDVAIGAGTLRQKPEPVALERPQMARQPVPSGTARRVRS